MIAPVRPRAVCRPARAFAPLPAKVRGGTRCGAGPDHHELLAPFATEHGGGERACLGQIVTEKCTNSVL